MKLVYTCSPAYDLLKHQVFQSTLREPWELLELRFESFHQGPPGSPAWHHLAAHRWARTAEILRQHSGEDLVVCDVDVQWLRPVQPLLAQGFSGCDVMLLRQHHGQGVNLGFLALRANERTVALVEAMAQAARSGQLVTQCVNSLIKKGHMPRPYARLPATFAHDHLDTPLLPPLDWLVLYHSVPPTESDAGEDRIQLKLAQHQTMQSRVRDFRVRKGPACDVPDPPLVRTNPPRVIAGDQPYVR
jgi:hypothetical protein